MTCETRQKRLDALRARQRVAVLVVGGGINGISTFRELALQGIDVVLAERGDFMSGASSAPSRMIHGGLRYMENGEFALVRESLNERNLLLRNAPHYVRPLPTAIPITDRLSGLFAAARRILGGNPPPGNRGALVVKIGLTLYDWYAGRRSPLPRHRFFGRRETGRRWPDLAAPFRFVALYHDAAISYPERLGVEMVIDAEAASSSALAINHVRFDGVEDGKAVLTDTVTGERFALEPDVIVNATGAWVDLTNRLVDAGAPSLIGGTKGSHIVLDSPQLARALGDTMIYFANRDGRVCIAFVHFGMVLAGSTDIPVVDPDAIRCEPEEVDYILGSIREIFPRINVEEKDIVYRFSGVRPLPRSAADVTARISRDHSVEWMPGTVPVLNLVGGKWTTFRAFGAEAADAVLARLGRTRNRSTETLAIGGGKDFPSGEAARAEWLEALAPSLQATPAVVNALATRYGSRAADLAPVLPSPPLVALPDYSCAEIAWMATNEHVVTLEDLVLRRMSLPFSGTLSMAGIEEIAAIAAPVLGWTAAETRRQIDRLAEHLATCHGLDAQSLTDRNTIRSDQHVPVQESPHEPPVRQRQMS
ncbi:glycerol-3-phosphate dehydrogenase/oxidase [Kumtagia ephedrae]|uniref:Glycerol-3-phosphate dehydrogenase n=1 Tax=Kumtagia ephedrae TaxID=2116701 RepID=A0A2P7SAT5_9HYPH|nr:glycerol-3-phosphate dehydrogenase/oxidase [Mesorhizobium ephedrae]PSJ59587.1 glycerol-3-phosphate dehydrogenase [Mesorhizobium ephedrae]